MVTLFFETLTAKGQMTEGCGWPDVMERPYDGLSGTYDLAYAFQREHTLINPMQMDDISLFKHFQPGDVGSCIGHVDVEKMPTGEVKMKEKTQPLPQEMPKHEPAAAGGHHRGVVGVLVADEHRSLDAVAVQGLGQPSCCKGCTACPFACTYY